MKGKSSIWIAQNFGNKQRNFTGAKFWARGYFWSTSGNITDDVIIIYLDKHTTPSKSGFSPAP